MLVKRAFFARGEPSNVIRDLWVIDEKVPQFVARKNAENKSVSASTPCDIGSVSEAWSPTKSPGNA
jgi:hypothetical protein